MEYRGGGKTGYTMRKVVIILILFILLRMCWAVIEELNCIVTEIRAVNSIADKYKDEVIIMKQLLQEVHEVRGIYERDIPLALDLQFHTFLVCQRFEADYDLVLAIMRAESDYQVNVENIHGKGKDYGIMQINEVHLEDFYKEGFTDIFNPYQNIEFAVKFLMSNSDIAEDEHQLLMAYHYGRQGMRELVKKGYRTTKYSRKVMEYREELRNGKQG